MVGCEPGGRWKQKKESGVSREHIRSAVKGVRRGPLVYRDPTPTKIVTDSKLRPTQVRAYVFYFHSQTELWFCFL